MAFFGKLLRGFRAGEAKLALNDAAFASAAPLAVSSPAFSDGGPMSAPYVGIKGDFPPLRWDNVPAGTQSFALLAQDIDVPLPTPFVHAVAYGLGPDMRELAAAALPRAASQQTPAAGVSIGTAFAGPAYAPPTPIPGHGPHHYIYQVFALDTVLQFPNRPGASDLVKAMRGHVLAKGAVTGIYEA